MKEFHEAIGLDVGEKRIGVARVSVVARLPEPVETVPYDAASFDVVARLVEEFAADTIVVGLPRNLASEDTAQTKFSRQFADTLKERGFKVHLQDEALTSKHAESLIRSGVYRQNARRRPVSVDEVAACLILQDFIGEHHDI